MGLGWCCSRGSIENRKPALIESLTNLALNDNYFN